MQIQKTSDYSGSTHMFKRAPATMVAPKMKRSNSNNSPGEVRLAQLQYR